ncbi:MAG: isoprenylcysteine carboxylmethyltransferase family protein [Anaerolineae bacterium]|nr:isoprenylcysteine carboxylmethyltransferase family protein [Anaerolineae bacterium]
MNLSRSHQTETSPEPRGRLPVRTVVGFVVFLVLGPLVLFLAAGTTDWMMAWVYTGIYLAASIGTRLIAVLSAPDMLHERAQSMSAKDIPTWDRWLMPVVALLGMFVSVLIAGLDHRNGWSPAVSTGVQWAAALLVAAGYLLASWAFLSNRFFSAMARIQTERNHTVIESGPYRFVRHPGYAGGLVSYLALPFMLGTLWALIPAALTGAALILRTALEDRMLQDGLTGYADYARRVRSRLIPGVW